MSPQPCARCGATFYVRDLDGGAYCLACGRPRPASCACVASPPVPSATQRVLALVGEGEIRRREIIARLGIPPRTVDHALRVLKRRGALIARREASYRLA